MSGLSPREALDLLDWKQRVFTLYREARETEDPAVGWDRWRAGRGDLFRSHPQSPLPKERRQGFMPLPYFPYDPAMRVLAEVEPTEPESLEIATSGEDVGSYTFVRFGRAGFEVAGRHEALDVYWLEGYGGGLFLPFRDATSGRETYGAGRYLLDTVKGADLGRVGDRLILDFNFAYNPSCAYDPRWVCPLAPPGNRLAIPVPAGERTSPER